MNFQKAYSSPGSGLETDSFTPSLIKLSLSTYYVYGTCLSAGYPKLNKIPKGSPEAEWGNQMRTDLGQGVAVRQQLKALPDVFRNCLRRHSRGSIHTIWAVRTDIVGVFSGLGTLHAFSH